jgi:hypothetical protein
MQFWKIKIGYLESTFLSEVFPKEIMDYFEIKGHYHLCSIADKVEYLLIDFDEKNEMPNGYSSTEYESKGFTNPCIVQDFPIRGKGVYLRIRKRRWRNKLTGSIIQRDFSFIAGGSKFTSELSDFLKDASGYASRYHEKYSQLLFREWEETSTTL